MARRRLVSRCTLKRVDLPIETEREVDGRWIASVTLFAGVHAYGSTREDAVQHVKALALRVIADRIENGELTPTPDSLQFIAA